MNSFLIWVSFTWFVIMFLDTFFKSCLFFPYIRLLQVTGVDIKPLMIMFHTTRYNRLIHRLGLWRPQTLKLWFNVGAFLGCVLILPCFYLYVIALKQMIKSSTIQDYDKSVLIPVIPGYNFPTNDWLYYLLVILLSTVIHEFGHALAASREGISTTDCGFSILGIVPIAFVKLRFEQFNEISRWQQLRILFAGIWHNIVMAILALLCLNIPLTPFYATGNGVTVLGIHQQSELNHPAGFEVGDKIYAIDNSEINTAEDWKLYLSDISERPQNGLCVPESADSMPKEFLNSSGYLYFKPEGDKDIQGKQLPVREAVENFSMCNQNFGCKMASTCMFPDLSSESYRFVVIKREKRPPVLYVGKMDELYKDVQLSCYTQKYWFLPVSFAEAVITFLEYLLMFSSGLVCFNMLPILTLDGRHIIEILVHMCLENHIPIYNQRMIIFFYIKAFSYIVATAFIILSIFKLYMFSF